MSDFVSNLNSYRHTLRAETVIGDLLNQGYNQDDILVEFEGAHKKNWDYDILGCESKGRKFVFKLSRNGIFQSLPEYLFLRPVEGGREEKEKIREFNEKQCINARVMFNPVESELFHKRVILENTENEILHSLGTYDFEGLTGFWRIDPGIDRKYRTRLIRIIPYLHSIIGDFEMTAMCLEFFLGDPVDYAVTSKSVPLTYEEDLLSVPGGIGSCSCGESFITGGECYEEARTLVFTIGPIRPAEIPEYLDNGEKRKMINLFYNYFIPVEIEMDVAFTINENSEGLTLDNSYLGYNS
jgi:hypothetical protein